MMLAAKGKLRRYLTPFNIFATLVLLVGAWLAVRRFSGGLAAVSNLSDTNPWGIWVGFDVLAGVALAAGGFTLATAVHVLNVERYAPVVRSAILTGFLGYALVVLGLGFDLGRPWRLPYPIFGSFGTTSVMFEVAWCVALYLTVLFFEFSPAMLEWLGLKRVRRWAVRLTLVLSVSGMVLSMLHQSSVGSLFLIAPQKLHPLWYSSYLPIFFFVSAVAAGLSMVIVEGALSHRFFHDRLGPELRARWDELTLGLGKGAAVVLYAYLGIKVVGISSDHHWALLWTSWGHWFLLELIGFVALPCALFTWGYRNRRVTTVRIAAAITVIGIVLNRLNVSVIAFNWKASEVYVPSWMEVATSLSIVVLGIVVFRWIVHRMPILSPHPDHESGHGQPASASLNSSGGQL